MIDARTASVIAAISVRYPGITIEVRPNPAPDMPTMPDFIMVLGVPPSLLREVDAFALQTAFEVFGDDPLPFLVGAFDPEQSAQLSRPSAFAGRVAEA